MTSSHAKHEIRLESKNENQVEIRRLLEEALMVCGPSLELTAIEASWGDTLSDEEALETLIRFLETGSIHDEVTEEAEEFEELQRAWHRGVTKH